MDTSDGSLASWAQTGGVLAFASAVLWQLRDLKPVLKAVGETLSDVRTTLAALLERERARAERLAAQDAQRPHARIVDAGGAPISQWEELTGPIVERQPTGGRSATPPAGTVIGGAYSLTKRRDGG